MEHRSVPEWQYDEQKHSGVDYASPTVAEDYDTYHGRFRDYRGEAQRIMARLGLGVEHTVVDLGCGTGAFAIAAAGMCRKVYAVDVSSAMLARCAKKAREAGLVNIETHHAGFLTYEHKGEPVDAVVSVVALHHLPDFWKAVALQRIYDMLKPDGKLYLFDVVFSFPVRAHRVELDGWIEGIRRAGGDSMAAETVMHVRDEFSTFDWIMEGILERAGFTVGQKHTDVQSCIAYVCSKKGAAT